MILKTLVIGGSGFLGGTIIEDLAKNALNPKQIYRTERVDGSISVVGLDKDFHQKYLLESFFAESGSRFQIINCASARYSNDSRASQNANFETPKLVLETVVRLSKNQVTWIQPESFWQYSSDVAPDQEYVRWKNEFSLYLRELVPSHNLKCQRVVLPHLFGVNDNLNRFFPKLFMKLLSQGSVVISGGSDNFVIADVADVSSYFVQLLSENSMNFKDEIVLFPYYEITLQNLVHDFLVGSDSKPEIFWDNSFSSTNPTMNFQHIIPNIRDSFRITPLQTSLENVRSWLIPKQPQR